jgi:hypothetical protein
VPLCIPLCKKTRPGAGARPLTLGTRHADHPLRAQLRTHAPQQTRLLLDDLVGHGEQRGRYFDAQQPSGLHVDDEPPPAGATETRFLGTAREATLPAAPHWRLLGIRESPRPAAGLHWSVSPRTSRTASPPADTQLACRVQHSRSRISSAAHGPAWRKANAGHVSLGQLKVMSPIESCRARRLSAAMSRAARGPT